MIIQTEVTNLKDALGPQAAARLDAFLQSEVARHVTIRAVHPPPSPDVLKQHLLQAIQKKQGVHP